ncbi:MAG TPA: hypothetical protein PKE05_06660 [Microthrixaceae bacterium]|nr:hypothetical protein [Gemmatimonadales bacterium]HMR95203.1 hypothetical protein [Microthrixaceae bacterium]HMT25955.1 hypothetical protein [Microthrixaceae bacterium]HMT62712.1 hypothetical protein [Microthrixaceae bacterium]
MTSETAITPARQTVPTSRELEAALAAIPKGRGEPEMNGAILDAAEHARGAAQALEVVFESVRGTAAAAPIKAALFAAIATSNAFGDCARDLVADVEAERTQMIADGRGADYMRGER